MGGYGRNAECTGLGYDDGASYAQGITGGTRGRVDDEAVSLISGQKFAIHFHPDGNHGGIVPFQDSHFVQGIWVSGEFRTFVFHLDDATFINFVCVVVEFGIVCGQQGNELFDRSRLFSLIDVAEQGEFESFCHSPNIN